ncbi:MAG: nucleotidyl transferase AbiEii/AbiGii toxin family protein [Verrucomicrobiia bacterium]
MPEKPANASGYNPGQLPRVRATCLYVATKLGDLMNDLVVVGGLVPSLLIDQQKRPPEVPAHVGTMDLDLGLAFALVNEQRYEAVAERLRRAGFAPDENAEGNPTRQRWQISDPPVTVDFLIEPADAMAQAGRLFSLERDLAAVIAPGLHLAFEDRESVALEGLTIHDEQARRTIQVSGPGAFVALKSLAFHLRGENKDAYDLHYVLRNFGSGPHDVARRLKPLLQDAMAQEAIRYLREDFGDRTALGPRRVAEFLYGRPDEATQADVAGFVRRLLTFVEPT